MNKCKYKKYKAKIIVTLKDGVRDPQGSAIETVLKRTGINENPQVSVGKFFEIELECDCKQSANEKFEKIAQEVLSNPVLERYEIVSSEE